MGVLTEKLSVDELPEMEFSEVESDVVEVPMREFTKYRLDKTYQFLASQLSALSDELERPLDVFNIGTHNGELDKYITDMPEDTVGSIRAIDIQETRVQEVRAQPFLQDDIESGRYQVSVMDGTNMEEVPDESFDFVNCTEVLVDLQGGNIEDLVHEAGRILRRGGMAVFTFPNAEHYNIDQFGKFEINEIGDRNEFEDIVRENVSGDVRIARFGQIEMEDETGEKNPIQPGDTSRSYRFDNNALDVYSVFSADGKQTSSPYFWIMCVRKFE